MRESEFVIIATIVPSTHADKMRKALGDASIGTVGDYSHCSFSIKGTGRFLPVGDAKPFIGKVGQLEEVEEEKIQTYCKKSELDLAVKTIKKAHPYEETVIEIYPLLEPGLGI